MSQDASRKKILALKKERAELLRTRSIEPSPETLADSSLLLQGYGTAARQIPKAPLAVLDVITAPLSIPLSLKTGKNWSPSGMYERAFDTVTGNRFKPTSKIGKIAEAVMDATSPSATALKLPKALAKVQDKAIPYVSHYLSKAHNAAKGTYHRSVKGVGSGAVAAGVSQHVVNEGESPLLALALGLGAGAGTKGASTILQKPTGLKVLDALAIKAAETAHQKASSAQKTLKDPTKSFLDAKPSIVLTEPIQKLVEKYRAIKDPALQEYFLKSSEGSVLKEMMGLPPSAPFSLFRHKVATFAQDVGHHTKGVTHTGVDSIYQALNEKIGKMGGFEIGGKAAAIPLNQIRSDIKDSIETAVGKLGPEPLRKWTVANKIWERYKKKRAPIVESVLEKKHKRGEAFKQSVEGMAEGAESPRFIASQLRGEDQKIYARAAMRELSGGKSLVDFAKGHVSKPFEWAARKVLEIRQKPAERRYFEAILADDPKVSNLLVSRILKEEDSPEARLLQLKKEREDLLK